MARFINIGKYLGLMYTLKGHDDDIRATIEFGDAEISNNFSSRFVATRWALGTIRQLTGQTRDEA